MENKEYGVVEEFRHPLVLIRGLPEVALGEVVVFESQTRGQVTALHKDSVEAMVFSNERLNPGTMVWRTKKQLSIPIHDGMCGAAINPIGESLFDDHMPADHNEKTEDHIIDKTPPHINTRSNIVHQFSTGTSVVDLLLTLGKGQREVILGDPTTGKNSFLLTTVRAHAERGIVIYAAIGKPWNDIRKVFNYIEQSTKKENVVLVASSADEVPSLIVQTPFTAMTLGEYWRDKGNDVLVVLDDLSTHAKFYREIGLLARRFPARESYPGDIFHLHARLLERAGNFIHPESRKEVSITCLPVAEITRGDITGYISSNLMSITDGHILFDEKIFSQGRRPAIDIGLSVTRVGGHTRTELQKQLYREMMSTIAKQRSAQKYVHFGSELPENLRDVLETGACLESFFSQPLYSVVPLQVQVTMVGMILQKWFNGRPETIEECRTLLSRAYESQEEINTMINSFQKSTGLEEFADRLEQNKEVILAVCQLAAKQPKKN